MKTCNLTIILFPVGIKVAPGGNNSPQLKFSPIILFDNHKNILNEKMFLLQVFVMISL